MKKFITITLAVFLCCFLTKSYSQLCGPDTVQYTLTKTTGLQFFPINNVTGASEVSQYYDAPQDITISGVTFPGFALSVPSVTCSLHIYAAGVDSMPTGAPLASAGIVVDSSTTNIANGVLFPSPVVVNSGYVLVFENNSANSVILVFNDWTAADGKGEFLASIKGVGIGWARTYLIDYDQVTPGIQPLDADALLSPIVSFDLVADFTYTPPCIQQPNTLVTFTNNSSPIFYSRFYNPILALLGSSSANFKWNFGDGSSSVSAIDTFHTYLTVSSFPVELYDTLIGWGATGWAVDTLVNLSIGPDADFTFTNNNLTTTFTDMSTGATSWLWDFGDGSNSVLQNPIHIYANPGIYMVCLTSSDASCGDTVCHPVIVLDAGVCGPDTARYPEAKLNTPQAQQLSSVIGFNAIGQYFNCPQAMTIYGVEFLGWSFSKPITRALLEIYPAGPDSMPIGAPVYSDSVDIDSAIGAFQLDDLRKFLPLSSGVVVSSPYVIVLKNNSTDIIGLLTNNWTSFDGGGEWLASAIPADSSNWLRSYNFPAPLPNFDADWLLHPVVSYNVEASFNSNTVCLLNPDTVVFTNTSSPIFGDRMYNSRFINGNGNTTWTWDYGDGSSLENIEDTSHYYVAGGVYQVSLSDTLSGFTSGPWIDDTTFVFQSSVTADFISNSFNLIANFTDISLGTPLSWSWDFGDGSGGSNQQNPMHTFPAGGGSFTVCLAIANSCGVDTFCQSVSINCPVPNAFFISSSNLLTANFTDQSTGTGLSGWSWDFDDGSPLSTVQNPTHTYTTDGTYNVCLTVNDSCGSQTSCQNVTITCAAPVPTFTWVRSGLDVTFTNNSTSPSSTGIFDWDWDFDDGNSSTVQNPPMHTYTNNAKYNVCLTVTDSCGSATFCDSVDVGVWIDPVILEKSISIFPNPSIGKVYVGIDLNITENVQVSVYNSIGELVKEYNAGDVRKTNIELDLSHYVNGIYLFEIGIGNQKVVRRINILK